MEDPAVCADGRIYERTAIGAWLANHGTSPKTNEPLHTRVLLPTTP